ncbi:low molecular weight protein-tyrosine-phosphatase [Acinetobacter ursingii]|uniref:low molecular weight protein-tyrosine-phosphatase n=1 Tax=Acinetobacter ursingii TaxID=108980 RepID=UPI0021CD97CD|nr:low molecular weight protein-tyrosine-phosphatase [Acinetobacter ursingii]MCU4482630.1 low molecular weight phosphotyrosine protein phosphatase [Acinetobacter ursingii]MCU4506929.1 low molecular weight phosphotyrosine protein phosphatase [Acinetobacter ursingii]MCU4570184.1 low molecular weight phosphotyrosine protein phosphatase [Acinetobacter ursingii]
MSSHPPYKVLCVCLGNICRSPTAEIVLRHFCDTYQLNVVVDSAGTSNYHPNKAPDPRSQQHALKRGYDLSSLRARQLRVQDFLEFDLILAMDHENFDDIQLFKQKALKQYKPHQLLATVALMSEHDPVYFGQALPDPYYGRADGFERVLDQCESSAQAWVQIFKQQSLNSKS